MRTEVSTQELHMRTQLPHKACKLILSYTGQSKSLLKAIKADAHKWHRCGHADFARKPRGLLPQILETLLANRKKAKQQMKAAQTNIERDVMNGKQLALKLCANSLYGFTGTSMDVGMLPCPEIASSVTYMGRKLTMSTKS